MLQWMGGSRRKVTASRKSTHKRQKKYFEQRKQQQQESAWKDDSSDIINTCTQRPINSQSLDILSLLDLSTIAQEHRSTCHSAKESLDGNVCTLDCQTTPELPKLHTSEVASADRTECREESYQWQNVYPERVSVTFHGSHHKDLSESEKVKHLEMPNDPQLSVLDLLGDDGPNSNLEGSSLHEAHVAFSVQGLGNVEMETPVHSPQRPVRYFPYGCSSSPRCTEKTRSVKNCTSRQDGLAAEADYSSEDDDILFCENDLPPRFMMDSFSYREHKKLMGKGCLQIIDDGPNLKNGVGNDYIFNNENENDNMWAESSTLPDDDFLCESECHSSWKTWPSQINLNSSDYFRYGNHVKNDFAFQNASINTNRVCTKEINTFDILDPVTPYAKHQISKNHLDFTNSNRTWYADLGKTSVVRSVINQPDWSNFKTEDERESLSFPSDDSCSSRAVWDEAVGNPPLDLLGKNVRAYGSEYCCPVRKKSVKNIYNHGRHCTKQDNIHESGNCPTPVASFQKRKGPHNNWLFDYEDVTGNRNSGLGSFCHTSGVKDSQPSSFQHWSDDMCDVDSVLKISVDAELFSESSRGDFQTKQSPLCSEKLTCCEPNNHNHYSETTFLPETSSRSGKSTSSSVFGGGNPQYPFRDIVCQGDIPVYESDCLNREKELEILKANSNKPELQEDACDGSNCLSSENKNNGDALDAGDSCSRFNVEEDRTQEMECPREPCSPEQGEYVSSSKGLEAPDNIERDLDGKVKEDNIVSTYQKNVQSHLSQNRCKDIEESRPEERNMESKKQNNITDSSSQVMMLESYVLQLLSVRVLKEASNCGSGNKEN